MTETIENSMKTRVTYNTDEKKVEEYEDDIEAYAASEVEENGNLDIRQSSIDAIMVSTCH